MRINNINNTSFGYNKELNETVNNKLKKAKRNKETALHLMELNNICNKTEDLLRKAEKENNTSLVDLYSYLFINIKPAITEELNSRFPLLNYRQTELETYQQEKKELNLGEEYHWLDQITDEISDNAILDGELIDEIKYNTEETYATTKTASSSTTTSKDKCPACLEKFIPTPTSPVGFVSIGGMQGVKNLLEDKILFPLRNPEMAKLDEIEYGKKYPRGTMFYGPPGCGKTTSIEALTAEADLPMYKLKISKAGSKYINESSNNIQNGYEYLCNVAKETEKPVFFVIDELETLAPKRDGESREDSKMVGTLLQIIEEARGKGVIVLGATNCFDMVDEAIRSRFDDKVYVGLPDADTRRGVLQIHLTRRTKGQALAQNPDELEKVVALTQGFSNRDIAILTDKASLIARKDNRRVITADDYIVPVRENQNMKVKESQYKDKQTRASVGFHK